eukprot:TRINITY_DN1020_c0_g1_i7.p2 TRINITY_DN1020_c0_g1~~TRINITY_DN1020_c0_g1_i7.p2  ORF type:complete len:282 (+),score=61.71 TRINITY_DN1020_c0_g1_i7:42-887(+)
MMYALLLVSTVAVGAVHEEVSRTGATLGACSSKRDWCVNWDAALSVTKDHRCKGANPTPCFSELAQWQVDRVVEAHNKVRAKHGACPITYSREVETWTKNSPGFVNTCTNRKLEHNSKRKLNGDYLGENLWGGSGYSELQDYDPVRGTGSWYCGEEGCWDYSASKSTGGTTGHFTQVVWKNSLEIGCALCHSKPGSGWTNIYFMCNYRIGGNYGGQYAANVGSLGSRTTPSGSTPRRRAVPRHPPPCPHRLRLLLQLLNPPLFLRQHPRLYQPLLQLLLLQ